MLKDDELQAVLLRAMEKGVNPYRSNRVIDYMKEAGMFPEDFDYDGFRDSIGQRGIVSRHLRAIRDRVLTANLPAPRFPTNQLCWEADIEDRPMVKPRQGAIPQL